MCKLKAFKSFVVMAIAASSILFTVNNVKAADSTTKPENKENFKSIILEKDKSQVVNLKFDLTAPVQGIRSELWETGIKREYESTPGDPSTKTDYYYFPEETGIKEFTENWDINNTYSYKHTGSDLEFKILHGLFYKDAGHTTWTKVDVAPEGGLLTDKLNYKITNITDLGTAPSFREENDLFDSEHHTSKWDSMSSPLTPDGRINTGNNCTVRLELFVPNGTKDLQICFGYYSSENTGTTSGTSAADIASNWGQNKAYYTNGVKFKEIEIKDWNKIEVLPIKKITVTDTLNCLLENTDFQIKLQDGTVEKGFSNLKIVPEGATVGVDEFLFPNLTDMPAQMKEVFDNHGYFTWAYSIERNDGVNKTYKTGPLYIGTADDSFPPKINDAEIRIKKNNESTPIVIGQTPTWDRKATIEACIDAEDWFTEKDDLYYQVKYNNKVITGDDFIKTSVIDGKYRVIGLNNEYIKREGDTGTFTITVRNEADATSSTGETIYAEIQKKISGLKIWTDEKPDVDLTCSDLNKYKTEKTLKAEATSKYGGLKYLWLEGASDYSSYKNIVDEKNEDRNKYINLLNMGGWSSDNTYKATKDEIYSVFVKDNTGNIEYKSLEVKKISNNTPIIESITATVTEGNVPVLKVEAKITGTETLQYALNNGPWQELNILEGVKDGNNIVKVRSKDTELETQKEKYVYLNALIGKENKFSARSLYNYIMQRPTDWTNETVTLYVYLPDSLKPILDPTPYSFTGSQWSSDNTQVVEKNGTYTLQVKDIYGYTHSSAPYQVKNIDKKAPGVTATNTDGKISIVAQDEESGVYKINMVGGSYKEEKTIQHCEKKETKSVSTMVETTESGAYILTVYDYAGNVTTKTINVNIKATPTPTPAPKPTLTPKTTPTPIPTPTKTSEKTPIIKPSDIDSENDKDEIDIYFRPKSDAGHSKTREIIESEKMEVNMEKNNIATSVTKIETPNTTGEDTKRFNRGLILTVIIIIGAAAAVFVISRDWKSILKKYNIDVESLKFWKKKS